MSPVRLIAALLALIVVTPIAAPITASARPAPLVDCPLRDAPYSLGSPLVDALLNPRAHDLIEAAVGPGFGGMPADFARTTAPTFGAIVTVRDAVQFSGKTGVDLPALDAALHGVPVTRADKVARCARYDTAAPHLALPPGPGPRLLLFEKINGFRDNPSVAAAHEALVAMAARKGWRLVSTDRAGAFNPRDLARFDAVIWNNVSGDVLTLSQRRAFQGFLARGGGYVGFHGSAGDPAWFWDWYADTLIGARFSGHPMKPQFQEARIVTDPAHPFAKALPPEWRMTDEWYSFSTNPRRSGAQVLLTLDESTYTRLGWAGGGNLDMGDHPLAWTRCLGRGRVFYSAIGHLPATYREPHNVALLETAITWAATARADCPGKAARAVSTAPHRRFTQDDQNGPDRAS